MNYEQKKRNLNHIRSTANSEFKLKFLDYFMKFFNTEEIIKLFWENVDDSLVYKHLKLRVENSKDKDLSEYKNLIDTIIMRLPEDNYNREVKFRSILSIVLSNLALKTKKEIFDKFINSHRKNNRKFAYHIANLIFDSRIKKRLLIAWKEFKDVYVLSILLDNNAITEDDLFKIWDECKDIEIFIILLKKNAVSAEKHIPAINEIIRSNYIDDWIKRKCYKILASENINNVLFLKETEPVTYIYLMSIYKQKIDDKFIKRTLYNLDDLELTGLLFWCIEKLGKSNLLIELYNEADKIEEKINKNLRDRVIST